jgi:hypothetical protein
MRTAGEPKDLIVAIQHEAQALNQDSLMPLFEMPLQFRAPAAAERRIPVDLYQFRHCDSPAGLMARPEAGPIVTVKVFIKEDVVAPVRVGLELLSATIDRPPALLITQENPG